MKISPEVFKAYDVRGHVPDMFDAEGAGTIASALLSLLESEGVKDNPTIVLGADSRPSSKDISKSVKDSLVAGGAKVLDIGPSTSPMFYFAVNKLSADGGVMVTASHNPPPDNGLKMVRSEARAIGAGSGMEDIRDLAMRGKFSDKEGGSVERKNIVSDYVKFLASHAEFSSKLSVVIDAGNGMAPIVLDTLLPLLDNLSYEKLYFDIDLTFPNHVANPIKAETLKDLQKKVLEMGADMGIAFDGDADRVGFVTAEGELVRGDFITALLAKEALRDEPGATVVFEVKTSRAVSEVIEESGGNPIRIETGHAAANRVLRETNGILAGELSGHYYFRETFSRDGAILAMLKVMRIVSGGVTLAKLIEPIKKRYVQSGEINFVVSGKDAALKRISEAFSDGEHSTLDGLTVEYSDWWFNVRASNTEDLLRLNVEAKTQKVRDEMLAKLTALIEK